MQRQLVERYHLLLAHVNIPLQAKILRPRIAIRQPEQSSRKLHGSSALEVAAAYR